jgi:hypothetical protein
MTITINFPPATIEALQAQAAASGKDVETLVKEAVEAKLVLSGLSFREILKPVHDEIEASGMSDEDVDTLAETAVAEARAGRKTSPKQQ